MLSSYQLVYNCGLKDDFLFMLLSKLDVLMYMEAGKMQTTAGHTSEQLTGSEIQEVSNKSLRRGW